MLLVQGFSHQKEALYIPLKDRTMTFHPSPTDHWMFVSSDEFEKWNLNFERRDEVE